MMKTAHLDKQQLMSNAQQQMDELLNQGQFNDRQKLAFT